MASSATNGKKRILLSGVFGPFGVDDDYGRKENIMELFHNQVTKGQDVASFRYLHRSFGLYFIAQNIDADVTVLDFPSKARFEKELKKGYDVVGISFIAPNFVKAREMARMTRTVSPGAVIVLGGHGAAIEDIDEKIDCDHVVKGEGIRWMRAYLGQDPDAPIYHPSIPSTESQSIYGVPVPGTPSALLVPGVGCVNACKFCSTSHFFGKRYTAYLATGQEIFETCCRISDEMKTDTFFVMDENFLKDQTRAEELLEQMELHQRFFRFQIFSSAEAVTAFGIENLVRLGVNFLWMGVESSSTEGNFEKNKGIDPRSLIGELRSRGIIVLASGILCQEHHTQNNIQAEIDFMVGLESDFVQFMLLTPLPVTELYRSQKKRGLLRDDLPLEEWHGQKYLSYNHPEFPGDSAEKWVRAAFRTDYVENSSSMYRVVKTTYMGYTRLLGMKRDANLDARLEQLREQLYVWACMLPGIQKNPVNELERWRAMRLDSLVEKEIGITAYQRALRTAIPVATAGWKLRVKLKGDVIQPRTIVTRYPTGGAGKVAQTMPKVLKFERPQSELGLDVAAAVSTT